MHLLRVGEANRIFREFVGVCGLPLVLFHDHFIGRPGRVAGLHVQTASERDAQIGRHHLEGRHVEYRPKVLAHNRASFDEQTAFTLRSQRGLDWELLGRDARTAIGRPGLEAVTAAEDTGTP